MRTLLVYFTLFVILITSCEDNNDDREPEFFEPPQISEITDSSLLEQDDYFLEYLSYEIQDIADEQDCFDASEWKFTPIGTKACGGPKGFIAYSSQIDTVYFLDKVNFYTIQQDVYNKKWGIISDCSLPPYPKGIVCIDRKPEFYY